MHSWSQYTVYSISNQNKKFCFPSLPHSLQLLEVCLAAAYIVHVCSSWSDISEGRPWTAIRNFSYRELQTLQLKHVYIYWQPFFVKSKYEKKIEIKLTQLNSVKLTYHQAKEKKDWCVWLQEPLNFLSGFIWTTHKYLLSYDRILLKTFF